MTKYIRYTLATVFFAASVGCLALWGRSYSNQLCGQLTGQRGTVTVRLSSGYAFAIFQPDRIASAHFDSPWTFWSEGGDWLTLANEQFLINEIGRFEILNRALHLPLWYPALIFVLTGVGVLRVSRQFSIRSALICVSVVALLLGMAVVL